MEHEGEVATPVSNMAGLSVDVGDHSLQDGEAESFYELDSSTESSGRGSAN